jgi:hypothetical protein
MSQRKSSVRQEAGVLGWQQLTEHQREAAAAIAEQLHGLVTSPSPRQPPHAWSFLPVIDRARRNHVFLIDGKRGSGKSTVLVTLLDAWSRMARGEDLQDGEENLCPWQGPAILPVGHLDLQPMAPSTNLLLHVIGALQRVVGVLTETDAGRPVARDGWELANEIPSQQAWRRFAKAAVAAGQGATAAPRSMDLEEQVAEMAYRERERLDLPRAFSDLVDALHGDMRVWLKQQNPKPPDGMLFVLAIDDADMNPHKSVELLELLRTLWHPNLAYVLTGDTDLFRSLIELDMAGASARPGTHTENARGQLIAMVPDILDKVIPRRQRFRLRELRPDARPGALVSALHEQGCANEHAAALLAHVRANAWLSPLIPGYLRRIADLAQALARRTDLRGQARAVFTDVIEELRSERPELGERSTVREEAGTLILDLGLERTVWTFQGQRQQAIELPRDRPMARARVATEMSAAVTMATDEQNALAIGERYRAAVLLGWRLDSESPAEYAIQGARPRIVKEPIVTLVPRPGFFQEGDNPPVWQFPHWPDGWHHVRACTSWDATAARVHPDDGARLERLAACFLASVLAGAGLDVAHIDLAGEPPWAKLAEGVAELAAGAGPAADWAITEAPLLAAPESGLSPVAANQWLAALAVALDQREIAWREPCLRRRHVRLLPRSIKRAEIKEEQERIEEALQRIDSHYMHYGLHGTLAREVSHALSIALESVPVRFGSWLAESRRPLGFTGEPKRWQNLADLITPERAEQLAHLPWTEQQALAEQVELETPYPKDRAQYVVYRLWEIANAASVHGLDELLTLAGNKLDVHVQRPSAKHAGVAIDAAFPNGTRLRLSKVDIPAFKELEPARNEPVYPALDAVLRLAIDVVADETEADGIESPGPDPIDLRQRVALRGMSLWWPFRLETAYGTMRLPVPQWTARIDWEILIQCWNRTIAKLQQWQREGTRFTHDNLDGFLAWYIRLIVSIHGNRQTAEFDDLSRGTWKALNLGDHLAHAVKSTNGNRITETQHSPRNTAYWDWLRTIPAIFAPEFGLHGEVVRSALKTYHGINFSRVPRAQTLETPGEKFLLRARHRLWKLSGKRGPELEEILRRIDEAHPQHPWVVLMREPGKPLA